MNKIEDGNFYDFETGGPIQVELKSVSARTFSLMRKFIYKDHNHSRPFVVPERLDTFETDLGSVPWYLAWTLPRFGEHLPAFLLHDALIPYKGKRKSYRGDLVDREEADRIMRDAMGELGSSWARRWLAWTGVSLMTAWLDSWRWKFAVAFTIIIVALLGFLATLQLFGVCAALPWMASSSLIVNLVEGLLFAFVVPLVLSVVWWPRWKVGAIAGIVLALVLHVTTAIFLIFAAYKTIEQVGQWIGSIYKKLFG